MYQNQPDPAVIAAEKAQRDGWFRKLKAKELNDKVVTKLQLLSLPLEMLCN
jgi:YidC/Oxa1 family membrane protein insertase